MIKQMISLFKYIPVLLLVHVLIFKYQSFTHTTGCTCYIRWFCPIKMRSNIFLFLHVFVVYKMLHCCWLIFTSRWNCDKSYARMWPVCVTFCAFDQSWLNHITTCWEHFVNFCEERAKNISWLLHTKVTLGYCCISLKIVQFFWVALILKLIQSNQPLCCLLLLLFFVVVFLFFECGFPEIKILPKVKQ